ncbi:outer membrane lipoprotein chaperone LolA [Serratia symbiotica]|uniref:Outer-membrane lipoprotein carrier protein n=2 Tax=Serratia symbiotica TaxID=138074 RepID=E9CM51_9GAMM|nr:outer membrane lipoprotein chaperone LolA [Serratia symbiotica]EFW12355.1 chaperone for lipoproteins [Serratia symbiotica str. Tucson]MBF1995255.1 outer membrane lipoprotein chaperone LolA [Serratia symbiotica]MBQ0957082.1 outer membrane lipoprotein chaperone LolA [Serratia symbiotica]QLH63281.1 outer membrane lipoprotein chaperone LolA [Serratia symbiotica]QTP13674.1 outer membrane lipoprotein chaperone LolA [Serratia symbiotica]
MKKLLVACCLLSGFASTSVLADATQDLQNRLAKVNSFHAHFSQTVTSSDGAAVQQGAGELWIKRPNLFNWHMTSPDESVLISDGQTLWFYNPFVEQVTATWLKNATGKTPFMLITRNNANDWKQYQVKQKGDDFELTPKSSSGNLKQFAITVTHSGTIRSFAAVEQDGQRSTYVLKSQQDVSADATKFTFIPPQGVTLDDQRQ